jgi:Tol biopolymer transport system component
VVLAVVFILVTGRGRSRQLRLEPVTHTTTAAWEDDPALSPDGSTVVYCSGHNGNIDLWSMDSAGGEPLRLTDHPARDRCPVWTADGREIVFASDRGGDWSLWRVGRLGGPATLLVEDAFDPAISPDGSRIAFSRRKRGEANRTIWIAAMNAPETARQLTPDGLGVWGHRQPAFSPDGQTVAFADFQDVWLVPADASTAPRRFTDATASFGDPTWFPDGRNLLLTSSLHDTVALWSVDRNGRGLARLTPGTGPERQPSLSRDGTLVAYSTHQEGSQVVVTDLLSGRRQALSTSSSDASPDLSADGDAVVFSSDRSGGFQLWLQALENGRPQGEPRPLTSGPGIPAVPSFSPDGERVAYYRIVDQRRELWMAPTRGGAAYQLTADAECDIHPAFSPDGGCICFSRTAHGQSQIWVLELDENGAVAPPRLAVASPDSASFSAWSPTGDRIALLSEGEVWVVPAPGCAIPTPAANTIATQVTNGAGARDLAWVDGGTALLVSGVWGGDSLEIRRLVVDDPDSSPETVLVIGDPRGEGTFGVSRDGRFISTIATHTRGDIWVARLVGS